MYIYNDIVFPKGLSTSIRFRWLKPRAILKIPYAKQNIACGFNRRTQRISITIISFAEIDIYNNTSPVVETTGYIENTTRKAKYSLRFQPQGQCISTMIYFGRLIDLDKSPVVETTGYIEIPHKR